MIAIIYQWRLHDDKREQFETAWTAITHLLKEQGAMGSALFDGPDNSVFAIARWPDRATRQAASARKADPKLYLQMIDAIAEELQESNLEERLNLWS